MFEKYLTKTGRLSCKQPQEIKNQWYIQKFIEVHGNIYDYSNVIYTRAKDKVEIICKEHGSFFQTPDSHINGNGCPQCQGNKQKDTEQCIKDFEQVHGVHYDYSSVIYINWSTKVEIICKEHGSFFQSPYSHLNGKGCPKCQGHNQNIIYILRCLDTGLTKIGITNHLDKRVATLGGNLKHLYHIMLEDPRQLELELHKKYRQYNKFNPTVKSGGTEFFQLSETQVEELIHYISSL